jgi:two-component sensor histidine kinase
MGTRHGRIAATAEQTSSAVAPRVSLPETLLEEFEEKLTLLVQVGNELSKSRTFDDLCRLAVEMGCACLGFDRLGLWFTTETPNLMAGSYGVDERGMVRDERRSRVKLDRGSNFHTVLNDRVPLLLSADAPIHDDQKRVVGHGHHAVAAVWDGEEIIGCLSTDTFITGRPITERDGKLLTLFASTLGHLCSRKRAEEELERKEIALIRLNDYLRHAMTETHHRVKNNLQIIAAMVDLQAMEHEEFVPTDQVYRLNSHIRTLAVVHDILTEQAKVDGLAETVSVTAILARLIPLLERTSGGRVIELEVEELRLPVRQTTTLALLANELVGNALKHGAGTVRVRLFADNGYAFVEVRDEGAGFPAGFDPAAAAHTGLELIRHLSRWDLGGEANFSNHPAGGAAATIRLPLSEAS